MRDLMNRIQPKPVIAPVVVSDNTAQVGAIIDKQGYDSLTYVIETGVLADADATFATLLEESDASNMAGATTVQAKDLVGTLALASFDFSADGKVLKVGYIGSKRYTRLTITPANNTGAAPLAAIALLGHPALQPTSNPPT
jgi:hypothetical protein